MFTVVARNLCDVTGAAVGCYDLRLMVRPGMTGWAQVRYRYANNLQEEIEKLRYDLYYIRHMSLWLDLRIMFATAAVLFGRHATDAPLTIRSAATAAAGRTFAFPPKVSRTTEA
jgi:hypothetical protein